MSTPDLRKLNGFPSSAALFEADGHARLLAPLGPERTSTGLSTLRTHISAASGKTAPTS